MDTDTKQSLLDAAVIAISAFVLYLIFLLPGVAWGNSASLQTYAITLASPNPSLYAGFDLPSAPSPIYAYPAHVWTKIILFGNPAWRINLFSAFLSALTLALLVMAVRNISSSRLTSTCAAISLIFSHSWFLNSVIPGTAILASFIFMVQIFLSIRALMTRSIKAESLSYCTALIGALLAPHNALVFLLPALYLFLSRFAASFWIFTGLSLAGIVFKSATSDFSINSYPLLIIFSLFEFPVVASLLILYGTMHLKKRMPELLKFLLLAWIGSAPATGGTDLIGLFAEMNSALLALSLLTGCGVEYLHARMIRKEDLKRWSNPILISIVVILPLVSTALTAYIFRHTRLDTYIAMKNEKIILRDNPWCDATWYALWPMKNGEGGEKLLADAERTIPSGSVILADPETMPVLDYARRVEGRLNNILLLSADIDEQLPELMSLSLEGRRIFLAGIDSRYYDAVALGKMGNIESSTGFFEWTMKK